MSDIYLSEACISYSTCLESFGTHYVPRNPFIANYENNCILCEEYLESSAHKIQDQINVETEVSIKVEVEEGFTHVFVDSILIKNKDPPLVWKK